MKNSKLRKPPHSAKLTVKNCSECKNEFTSHRKDAITCSPACRKQRSLKNIENKKQKYKDDKKKREAAWNKLRQQPLILATQLNRMRSKDIPQKAFNIYEDIITNRRNHHIAKPQSEWPVVKPVLILMGAVAVLVLVHTYVNRKK